MSSTYYRLNSQNVQIIFSMLRPAYISIVHGLPIAVLIWIISTFCIAGISGQVLYTKYIYINGSPVFNRCLATDHTGDLFLLSDQKEDTSAASRLFITKLSSDGNLVWSKRIYIQDSVFNDTDPGNFTYANPLFSSISVDTGGICNVLIQKYNNSFERKVYYFLLRIDSDGQLLWAKRIKIPFTAYLSYQAPSLTSSSGDIVLSPSLLDYMSLISFSPSGTLRFSYKLTDTTNMVLKNPMFDIITTHDRNIFALAKSDSNLLGIKLDSAGNVLWSKKHDGQYYYRGYSIVERFIQNDFLVAGLIDDGQPYMAGSIIQLDSLFNIQSAYKYTTGTNLSFFTKVYQFSTSFCSITLDKTMAFYDLQGQNILNKRYNPNLPFMMGIGSYSGGIISGTPGASYQDYLYLSYGNCISKIQAPNVTDDCYIKSDTLYRDTLTDTFIHLNNIVKRSILPLQIKDANVSLSEISASLIDTCWLVSTGVAEMDVSNVIIFPNPSDGGLFWLQNTGEIDWEGYMYNLMGETVVRVDLERMTTKMLQLSPGLYFLELNSDKGHHISSRLIAY